MRNGLDMNQSSSLLFSFSTQSDWLSLFSSLFSQFVTGNTLTPISLFFDCLIFVGEVTRSDQRSDSFYADFHSHWNRHGFCRKLILVIFSFISLSQTRVFLGQQNHLDLFVK